MASTTPETGAQVAFSKAEQQAPPQHLTQQQLQQQQSSAATDPNSRIQIHLDGRIDNSMHEQDLATPRRRARDSAQEREVPGSRDQEETQNDLSNSQSQASQLSGTWEQFDDGGNPTGHAAVMPPLPMRQQPHPPPKQAFPAPPHWAVPPLGRQPGSPGLVLPQPEWTKTKQLEDQLAEVAKQMEAMQEKLFDLESTKDQLEKQNNASLQKLVEANQLRVEDRKTHLDLFDTLKAQMDSLKENLPKAKGGNPSYKGDFDEDDPTSLKFGKKDDNYAYFVSKFAQHFPAFDPKRSELQLSAWEDYWEAIEGFKRITRCSDMVVAYLIKDSAPQGSELAVCLRDVNHTGENGYIDIHDLGLEGIKKRMKEDFGPKMHNMAHQARHQWESTRRKFKERPAWFFKRLEMNEWLMHKLDPEHKPSSNFRAHLIFHNSGLERKERLKIYEKAEGVFDYDVFKKIILERFSMKHEYDCAMVTQAFKNRGSMNVHHAYVVHDPDNDQEGTDLYPEDCDEEDADASVDLSGGYFSPQKPVLMATGDFFEENPDQEEPYEEITEHEVNWVNECGEDEEDPENWG